MQAQPAISLVNAQRQPEAQVVQAQPPPGPFGTGFRAPPPVLRRNPSASVVLAVRRAERDGESAGGGDAPASRRGRRCCGADLRGMPSPLLIIICALGDATYTALSPFFPQAAATAGLSATATGVVFSCGMWAGVLVTPLAIYLSHFASSRVLLSSCVLLQAALTGGFALLPLLRTPTSTFAVAFTLRLVQGGVAAIYEVTVSSLIMCSVPPARVAAALGLQEAARGVGLMIGPSAGGLLFSLGGFPLPFIICSAALFILGMAVAVFLPPDPAQANEVGAKMVTFGELLYLPAVGAIILLMTALSAALTAPDPVLGPYAEERFGLNPAQIGLLFSSCTIAYALLSPVIGEIGGRFGNFKVLVAGLVAAAAAFIVLGPSPWIPQRLLPRSASLLFVGMGLSGVGDSTLTCGAAAMLQAALSAGHETEEVADTVAGLLSVSWTLGALVGPLMGATLVERFGFPRAMSLTSVGLLAIAALGSCAHATSRPATTAARARRQRLLGIRVQYF
mmetsp:Transcript_11277/g.29536  ORF Transcript_11277/g.29536 Transcript_11277/m.29536 type:complete len:507 (-) Transcript_11277:63-1583(-)